MIILVFPESQRREEEEEEEEENFGMRVSRHECVYKP
jgi:hypothetical protein